MMTAISELQSPSEMMPVECTRSVRSYSTISVRISTSMRAAIEECAIQRGISASEVARIAIEKELGIRNGVWIDLPDAILGRIETDVLDGKFLSPGEAIRYYLVKGLGIDDSEVLE